MQNESEHQFLQRIFSLKFLGVRHLVTKREKGKKLQGKLFSSSIMLMGGVQIHWFKLVTSCRRRGLRNLDLWLLGPTTFFTSVECKPLHGKGHLLDEIILSLPNRVQGSLKLTLGRVHFYEIVVDHI